MAKLDHNQISIYVRRSVLECLAAQRNCCCADTLTHAEWYVEVVDTYCKTVMITSQTRPALKTNSAFASQSARYRVDELAGRLTPKASRFLRGTE